MKVKDKLMLEHLGLCEHRPVNIVILSDSVSQGAVINNNDYEKLR